MVSVYENKTNEPVMGVMGVMGGLFAPDDIRDWPKVDQTSKEYLLDIAAVPIVNARIRTPSSRSDMLRRQVTELR